MVPYTVGAFAPFLTAVVSVSFCAFMAVLKTSDGLVLERRRSGKTRRCRAGAASCRDWLA